MSKKKIIAIILCIVLIVVLIFLFNLGRKVYILSKYTDKYNEYSKITNFYKKTNSEQDVTTEFWRKDNLGFLKRTSKDDVRMIYYGEDYNWIIVDNKDGKNAVKMFKEGEIQDLTTGTLYMNNIIDKLNMAFISNISTEKINNIDCYKIKINNEWQLFVDKDTFLVMREINGSIDTGVIEYKINKVRDEDVLMPNLAGYTINDTIQQSN